VHSDADVEFAVQRVVYGGFAHAGQSCISVQRIFLHKSIADQFIDLLVTRANALKVGDPSDPTVDLGGVVNDDAASRISAWLDEAKAAGATVLAGGGREGRVFEPTILTDVPRDLRICAQEAFAPVVVVERFAEFDSALEYLGKTRYGLQAGLFTYDMRLIDRAFRSLEVGGLIVNDIPTFRTDQMPYGGVRDSGVGKEGPRFAIEEMTEPRLLVVNLDRPKLV